MNNPMEENSIGPKDGQWYLRRCGQYATIKPTLHLDSKEVTVGRLDNMTHVIEEKFSFVSRCHVIFRFHDGAWSLEDNGSLNGIYLNNKRVAPKLQVQLQEHDIIGMGVPTTKLNDGRALIYTLQMRKLCVNDRENEVFSSKDDALLKCKLPVSVQSEKIQQSNGKTSRVLPCAESKNITKINETGVINSEVHLMSSLPPTFSEKLNIQGHRKGEVSTDKEKVIPPVHLPLIPHKNTAQSESCDNTVSAISSLETSKKCQLHASSKMCKSSTQQIKPISERATIQQHDGTVQKGSYVELVDSESDDIPLLQLSTSRTPHFKPHTNSDPECITLSDSEDQTVQANTKANIIKLPEDYRCEKLGAKTSNPHQLKDVKVKIERLSFLPGCETIDLTKSPIRSSSISGTHLKISVKQEFENEAALENSAKCDDMDVSHSVKLVSVKQEMEESRLQNHLKTENSAVASSSSSSSSAGDQQGDCTFVPKSIKQEPDVDFFKYSQEDEVIVISDSEDYFSSSQNVDFENDDCDWNASSCISFHEISDTEHNEKLTMTSSTAVVKQNDFSDEALRKRLIFIDEVEKSGAKELLIDSIPSISLERKTDFSSDSNDSDGRQEESAKKDLSTKHTAKKLASPSKDKGKDQFFPELTSSGSSDDDADVGKVVRKDKSPQNKSSIKSRFYSFKEKEARSAFFKRRTTCSKVSATKNEKTKSEKMKKKITKCSPHKLEKKMGPIVPLGSRSSGAGKPVRLNFSNLQTKQKDSGTAVIRVSPVKRKHPRTSKDSAKPKDDSTMTTKDAKFRFANRGAFLANDLGKMLSTFKIPKKKPCAGGEQKSISKSSKVIEKKVSQGQVESTFSIESLLPSDGKEMPLSTEDSLKLKVVPDPKAVDKPNEQMPNKRSNVAKRKSSTEAVSLTSTNTKKVRFAEGNEMFEIPAINRARLKESNPIDGSGPIITLPPVQLEDVLVHMLTWNPVWLKQQERNANPPPVVAVKLWPTLLCYKSYADYWNVFYPLLLLETWAQVSKEWYSYAGRCIVGAVIIKDVVLNCKLLEMTCYGLVTDEEHRQEWCIRDGHFLILDIPIINNKAACAENQTQILKVFGYVDYFGKLFQKNDELLAILKEHPHIKNSTAKLTKLIIKVKPRELNIDYVKLMRIQVVSYLRPTFRQFEALLRLPRSSMAKNILQPRLLAFELHRGISHNMRAKGKFNNKQKEAIGCVTDACSRGCSSRICLLQGPPGTGKTNMIVGLAQQLLYAADMKQKLGMKPKILLTAPSNAAVDELVMRLIKVKQELGKHKRLRLIRIGPPHQIHPDVRDYTLDSLLKSNLDARLKEKSSMESVEYELKTLEAKRNGMKSVLDSLLIRNEVEKARQYELQLENVTNRLERLKQQKEKSYIPPVDFRKEEQEMISVLLKGADVIATTLASCRQSFLKLEFPSQVMFTVCIVDEACQCIEQDTLLPLMFGITKLVLVGDPQQLPATVISSKAVEMGLNQSLFERFNKYFTTHDLPSPVFMLTKQYRMHPEICKFPSKFFYEGKLESDSLLESKYQSFPIVPYLIFNLLDAQETGNKGDLCNTQEIDFVLQLLKIIVAHVNSTTSIGVITPYQTQRTKIREALKLNLIEFCGRVEVNTVDAFQGREKDVIILSTVRAKSFNGGIGFLAQEKRLNVALTRAKQSFLVCGHLDTLSVHSYWRALIHDAQDRGLEVKINKETTPDQVKMLTLKLPH